MGKIVDIEEHKKVWVTGWVVCLKCCVPHLSVHHITSADYGSEIECPECGEFACIEVNYAIYGEDANGGVTWRNLYLEKQTQLTAANEKIARLTEALGYYADESVYEDRLQDAGCGCCSDIAEPAIFDDEGKIARQALKEEE